MPRYVAFLRAINVGGHVVKMDRLRTLFSELGFTNVETFIASGNVLFDSPSKSIAATEKKIEPHLEKSLGYAVPTLVRPLAGLAAIADDHSIVLGEGHSIHVGFLRAAPATAAVAKIEALGTDKEELRVRGAHIYWWCKIRLNESEITNTMWKNALEGQPVTFRNINTVRRLAAKAGT